MTQSMIKLI